LPQIQKELTTLQQIADNLPADSTDSVLRFADEEFSHLKQSIDSTSAQIAAELQAENDLQRQLQDLDKTLEVQLMHADETPVETLNQLKQIAHELAKSEAIPNRQFVEHKEDPNINSQLLLQKMNDLEARTELNGKFTQLKTSLEARIKSTYDVLDQVRDEGVKSAEDAEASHKLLTVS
jgi:hypothetical protein